MSKPILFETISRDKYDKLTPEQKAAKNYQIKEVDGSVSKAIGNLEGSGGSGGIKYFEVSIVTDGSNYEYVTVNTAKEIDDYYKENGNFGIDYYIRKDETDYHNKALCMGAMILGDHPYPTFRCFGKSKFNDAAFTYVEEYEGKYVLVAESWL